MSGIKKDIENALKRAKLSQEHLDQPNAHVVAGEGEDLHVLVKVSEATDQIEDLGANIAGSDYVLGATEQERMKLDDLGEWRHFTFEGLKNEDTEAAAGKRPQTLVLSAMKDDEPVEGFLAQMDLGFTLGGLIEGQDLVVRPVPEGERDGVKFFKIGNPREQAYMQMVLGRGVDEVVSEKDLSDFRDLYGKNAAVASGILSMTMLVSPPPTAKAPRIVPDDLSAEPEEQEGPFSADVNEFLQSIGKLPEGEPTIDWAEATLDFVDDHHADDVSEEVAIALRDIYAQLSAQCADEEDDLLGLGGDDDETQEPAAIVNRGERSLAASRTMKIEQFRAALEGLDVSDASMKKLGTQMANALQQRRTPKIVLIAGPRNSAADTMIEVATSLVGDNPLKIAGSDITEPGFPMLYGAKNGVAMGNALLSDNSIKQHRKTAASHAPILIDNLEAAGTAGIDDEERELAATDFLERLVEMTRTGTTKTYSGGSQAEEDVILANTVLLLRYEGDASELKELIGSNPDLRELKRDMIETDALEPNAAVVNIAKRLTLQLPEYGAPDGANVQFSSRVEAALTSAFENMGPAAHDLFEDQLRRDILDVIGEHPIVDIEVDFAQNANGGDLLTKRDQEKIADGKLPRLAQHVFGVKDAG